MGRSEGRVAGRQGPRRPAGTGALERQANTSGGRGTFVNRGPALRTAREPGPDLIHGNRRDRARHYLIGVPRNLYDAGRGCKNGLASGRPESARPEDVAAPSAPENVPRGAPRADGPRLHARLRTTRGVRWWGRWGERAPPRFSRSPFKFRDVPGCKRLREGRGAGGTRTGSRGPPQVSDPSTAPCLLPRGAA